MSFADELSGNFRVINSIYDLVAFSYRYLTSIVQNQGVFLAEYIEENEEAEQVNPNLCMLHRFMYEVRNLLKQNAMETGRNCLSNDIIDLVKETEESLVSYEEENLCKATVPFFLLLGVDLYILDCPYCTQQNAPLNEHWQECCLVYLNTAKSMIDEVACDRNYADLIHKNEIRKHFKMIIILEKKEMPEQCKKFNMVTLQKNQNDLEAIIKEGIIEIATIPTTKDKCLDFVIKRGSAFQVKYHKKCMTDIKNRVINLLDKAIERGANIIVFPEYICEAGIQEAIRERLREISFAEPEKLRKLLLVVAGSGWTADSNNVGKVYSYDGILLGNEYKYSAFDNTIEGKKYTERLMNPGKEITLVKIPQIGIVQIEICRNVSEGDLSAKIAKVFSPQFLLISAWSTSVDIAFRPQLENIVSQNHKTCAVVSNCCAAFEREFKENIGLVIAPQKEGSVVTANVKYICRNKEKCAECNGQDCIYMCSLDFNVSKRKEDVEIDIIGELLSCNQEVATI